MIQGAAAGVRFDPACAADGATLLAMVRAFHAEDGHPLEASSEAAVLRVAAGEELARAWIVRRASEAVGYLTLTLGYSV